MDFPNLVRPTLNTISTGSIESLGSVISTAFTGAASVTLVANQAYFVPFTLYEGATAYKMSCIVGTTPTGNVDVGIYDAQMNRLVNTGSVAQGTTATLQEFDITDTYLPAGNYFMALQPSGAAQVFGWGVADEIILAQTPLYMQAVGSFGLPATATPILSTDASPPMILLCVHFSSLV